ncbi:hypothetical protein OJAV_G00005990 [Oryzias javanicus]|uniref:Uncharacterized protein n=1 Tax=Oryzias javanicus TaxID=123683 RepID=A0A3S2UQQ7_ORYJA|nr:hypothetical protein OJAV_G00005990 [Oryzias javanicus]
MDSEHRRGQIKEVGRARASRVASQGCAVARSRAGSILEPLSTGTCPEEENGKTQDGSPLLVASFSLTKTTLTSLSSF